MSQEINKEIAEKLFDKEVFEKDGHWSTRGSEGFVCYLKQYSEYILDTWEVVEKMFDLGWKLHVDLNRKRTVAIFHKRHWVKYLEGKGRAKCVSEAICKAGLKAINDSP